MSALFGARDPPLGCSCTPADGLYSVPPTLSAAAAAPTWRRPEGCPKPSPKARSHPACRASARIGWPRRREEILEPDLPIVDPHHHLWDRPAAPLPARRAAGRHRQRPQHRARPSSSSAGRCYRADGPRRAAPGRRDRVRQRHRGDERERQLRPDARLRGHRRPRRPDARATRVEEVLRGAHARRRAAASGHPPRARPGRTGGRGPRSHVQRAAAPATATRQFREGFARARAARPLVRRLALPPPAPRADGAGPRLPRAADRARPRRRAARDRPVRGQARGDLRRLARDIRELATCPNVLRQARRPRHARLRLRTSTTRARRRPPRSWPTPGGPTSRPASRRSGPTRCMFESNFPVDKGTCSYARLLERLQAPRLRRLRHREGRPLPRHRQAVLSVGLARFLLDGEGLGVG